MKEQKNVRDNFIEGVKAGLPIGLGYFSVSFAFGIFAVGKGLSVFEALLISMTNLTSAGQLAGVPIIAAGGSLIELALSQLVINIRYSLMSVSLSQKLDKSVTLPDRFIISFGNTDEVFAVASSKKGKLYTSYLLGLILLPFLFWSAGTLVGAVSGNILPESVVSALGITIYGMFIAIIVPASRDDRPTLFCVLLSAALSCAFKYIDLLKSLSGGFTVIICALVASTVMAVLAPKDVKSIDGAEEVRKVDK